MWEPCSLKRYCAVSSLSRVLLKYDNDCSVVRASQLIAFFEQFSTFFRPWTIF